MLRSLFAQLGSSGRRVLKRTADFRSAVLGTSDPSTSDHAASTDPRSRLQTLPANDDNFAPDGDGLASTHDSHRLIEDMRLYLNACPVVRVAYPVAGTVRSRHFAHVAGDASVFRVRALREPVELTGAACFWIDRPLADVTALQRRRSLMRLVNPTSERLPRPSSPETQPIAEDTAPAAPPLIVSIQALRAVAVMLVMSMHIVTGAWLISRNELWGSVAKIGMAYGNAGVDLFFVISGAIMYMLTRSRRRDSGLAEASDYLTRRAVRIYPLFWITLAFAFAFKPDHTISFASLTLYVAPVQSPVAWTLPFEMRFYVVVGLLLLCARRSLDQALMVWGAVQLVLYALATAGVIAQPYFGSTLMTEFSMGLCVGALLTRRIVVAPVMLAVLSILCLIASCVAIYGGGRPFLDAYRHVIYGIPFAVLLYAVVTLENLGKIKVPAILRGLGDMSYSIYLWHYPISEFVGEKTAAHSHKFAIGERFTFQVVVLSLIVSAISYHLIEKPSLRYGKALLRRRRTLSTVAQFPLVHRPATFEHVAPAQRRAG